MTVLRRRIIRLLDSALGKVDKERRSPSTDGQVHGFRFRAYREALRPGQHPATCIQLLDVPPRPSVFRSGIEVHVVKGIVGGGPLCVHERSRAHTPTLCVVAHTSYTAEVIFEALERTTVENLTPGRAAIKDALTRVKIRDDPYGLLPQCQRSNPRSANSRDVSRIVPPSGRGQAKPEFRMASREARLHPESESPPHISVTPAKAPGGTRGHPVAGSRSETSGASHLTGSRGFMALMVASDIRWGSSSPPGTVRPERNC